MTSNSLLTSGFNQNYTDSIWMEIHLCNLCQHAISCHGYRLMPIIFLIISKISMYSVPVVSPLILQLCQRERKVDDMRGLALLISWARFFILTKKLRKGIKELAESCFILTDGKLRIYGQDVLNQFISIPLMLPSNLTIHYLSLVFISDTLNLSYSFPLQEK